MGILDSELKKKRKRKKKRIFLVEKEAWGLIGDIQYDCLAFSVVWFVGKWATQLCQIMCED